MSITWITPFEAAMSVLITLASSIFTPADGVDRHRLPCTVLASVSFTTSAAITLPGTTW